MRHFHSNCMVSLGGRHTRPEARMVSTFHPKPLNPGLSTLNPELLILTTGDADTSCNLPPKTPQPSAPKPLNPEPQPHTTGDVDDHHARRRLPRPRGDAHHPLRGQPQAQELQGTSTAVMQNTHTHFTEDASAQDLERWHVRPSFRSFRFNSPNIAKRHAFPHDREEC